MICVILNADTHSDSLGLLTCTQSQPLLDKAPCTPVWNQPDPFFGSKSRVTVYKLVSILDNDLTSVWSSPWSMTLSKLQAASQLEAEGRQFFWT